MNLGALGRQDHAHTCVLLKNKVIWGLYIIIHTLTVFKTILQHKQDKAYITYFYHN